MLVFFEILTLVSLIPWLIGFWWGAYRTVILDIPSSTKNAGICLVWGIINWILFMSVYVTR